MFNNSYLIAFIIGYLGTYALYVLLSHGLGNKATYLQLRRFIPCALLAVLPVALAKLSLTDALFVIPAVICAMWVITYPTLYYISNHKVSSDFEFHFEAVFGLYLISWICSIGLLAKQAIVLAIPLTIGVTIIEVILLLIPVAQWIYFGLYKACINENGMQMLQETHYNEIIEFFKSMPWYLNISSLFGVVGAVAIIGTSNYATLTTPITLDYKVNLILAGIAVFLSIYLWKKKHGVFIRTAIVEFYLDIKEYMETNKLYAKNLQDRYAALEVKRLAEAFAKPSTILLVIGESESRDYMSAFNEDYKYSTTPWLSAMKQDEHFTLFPNAFSCIANTVASLSNALTEMNQYNNK
ncbi:MAG: hypothetical protein SO119_03435, partial [Phascolarctobacterium sp.]|nr:hypothetical protein [Phascolarctobacterium sp.]